MSGTWNVEKGVHFWFGIRDGKFPLYSGHVSEDMISVSSREKVEERLIRSCKFDLFLRWVPYARSNVVSSAYSC